VLGAKYTAICGGRDGACDFYVESPAVGAAGVARGRILGAVDGNGGDFGAVIPRLLKNWVRSDELYPPPSSMRAMHCPEPVAPDGKRTLRLEEANRKRRWRWVARWDFAQTEMRFGLGAIVEAENAFRQCRRGRRL
jgi:hypothetical protein